ncbi:prolyl 4-hydroxylase 1 isoform X1 [Fagus crenata]
MSAFAMKIVFGLLTLVTVGMIIGALFQLAFIRRLEDSYEFPSSRGLQGNKNDGYLQLHRGIPDWNNDKDARILRLGYVKPEIISWSPRIIVLHNFLSMEECDYLRAIARPRLEFSTVVDTETGKAVKSDIRTSSGMFISFEEKKYPMIEAIEKRISVYSQVPVENGELIQVLRYEKSQYCKLHHDYFSDASNVKLGQRIATIIMYLSDNVEGGETHFPLAGSGECSCGGKTVKGMSVKPKKGDAVLFWSMGLDGQLNPNSIHAGCEGRVKDFVLTIFVRLRYEASSWEQKKCQAFDDDKGHFPDGAASLIYES